MLVISLFVSLFFLSHSRNFPLFFYRMTGFFKIYRI